MAVPYSSAEVSFPGVSHGRKGTIEEVRSSEKECGGMENNMSCSSNSSKVASGEQEQNIVGHSRKRLVLSR